MDVIVIETEAFYRLVEEVIDRVQPRQKEKWILEEEALAMLGIRSKTTLWEMRTGGKIRYSQPSKKIILYDRESVENYIEKNAKDTF